MAQHPGADGVCDPRSAFVTDIPGSSVGRLNLTSPERSVIRVEVSRNARIHPLLRLAWWLERWRGAVHLPTGSWLGGVLFHSRALFFNLRTMLMQALIYEPGMRYRCRSLGQKLRLVGPAPRIAGDGVIDIGDDVRLGEGMVIIVGIGLAEPAHLEIQSHVTFGGNHTIVVARHISIGNYCWIGAGTNIYDNDMHPLDPAQRRLAWGVDHSQIGSAPVIIEDDVWIGLNATILKGVTLHRGAVVAAGAVVTESVPPLCLVAGNPARVVKRLSEDVATTAEGPTPLPSA